ncbi:MAG: hypothetical protein DME75_12820 [Verrucomicrobia bacterium]|nr:MAG: hypothetical protein DME75_12820 [Verrucomicrobiota bacterium]
MLRDAELRSQFLLRDDDVALVAYQSRKSIKRALSLLSEAATSSFLVNVGVTLFRRPQKEVAPRSATRLRIVGTACALKFRAPWLLFA